MRKTNVNGLLFCSRLKTRCISRNVSLKQKRYGRVSKTTEIKNDATCVNRRNTYICFVCVSNRVVSPFWVKTVGSLGPKTIEQLKQLYPIGGTARHVRL